MPTPFLGESENTISFLAQDGTPMTAAKDMMPQDFMAGLQNPMLEPRMSEPAPIAIPDVQPPPDAMAIPSPLPPPEQVAIPMEAPAQPQSKTSDELSFASSAMPGAIQIQPAMMDSQKAFNEGLDTQMAGAKKQIAAGQALANAQMGFADQMQSQMLERQKRAEDEQRAMMTHVDRENSKLADLTQKFQEQGSVDPNRFYNNQSFGQKVIGALGIALSGIGSGLTGQPNMALKMIDTMIERDINAQKDNLEKSRSAISAQQSLVGNMRAQFGDKMQADAASFRTMYDVAEMKLKQMLAGVQSQTAMAEGQKVLGDLQMKKAQYDMAFKQFAAKSFNDQQIRQGLPIRDPLAVDEKQRDKLVRIGPNDYRMATNDVSAKDLNKQLPAMDSMIEKLNRLKGLMEKHGTEILPTEAKGEMESLKTQVLLDMKNAEGLGALDKGALEAGEAIIGDPTAFFQSSAQARLQSLIDSGLEKKQKLLETNLPYYKRLPSPNRDGE